MPKGPKKITQKDISRITNSTLHPPRQFAHHGHYIPPLFRLPSESLTNITSFLDPVSLCSLAQTCRKLYEHVSDDDTWRRAFVCRFLGIQPEDPLNEIRALTFRSTQRTWRHEFIHRYTIRGLWSRSNSPMISHSPVISPISVIHVMADYGLLSASTNRCVVARSFPFRNEVLKGYLYGTGIPPGMGIDLPNINFMPNVSTCVLASDGTTAKVIWGRQDGSIIIVSHPRTMSGTRSPAHILTSSVQQEHEGAVLDGTWAADGNAFVTAGADGRVKVWTVTPFGCAWTSKKHLLGRDTDAISRVVEDLANGLVVAASRSGDLIILSGFKVPSLGARDAPLRDIQNLCVSVRTFPTPDVGPALVPQQISALYFQVSSPTHLSILACYLSTSQFYRCSVNLLDEQVNIKAFGNAGFGAIRCIQPAFSNDSAEQSFVLVGTQLGIIGIYDWGTTSLSSDPYPASRHVDVFSDAQVTSLALNPFVVVAGSSRGTITVLDLLTFETLRSFPSPGNNDVRQIELVGELLLANVGSKVLAWRADHFVSGGKNSVRSKGKGKQGGHRKWFKQVELRSDVADIRNPEEKPSLNRSLLAEREQLMQLDSLGLSEQEAVEYTLMLSRDEVLLRLQSGTSKHVDEGIFDMDESSRGQSRSDQSSSSSSSPRQYSPPLRPSTSEPFTNSHGHLVSLASRSSSNIKVQVSPRFNPEPKQAGGLPGSPPDSQSMPSKGGPSSSPPRPFSPSALESPSPLVITPPKQVFTVGTSSGKPNAWSKPLHGIGLSALPSAQTGKPLPPPPCTHWEVEAERIRQVEDPELRFALEVSLAEAQSREVGDVGGT